jgi:hypothetical protein
MKLLRLMEVRAQLKRQKESQEVDRLNTEVVKCSKIGHELDDISREKASNMEPQNVYMFKSDRHLIMKVMHQKEIINNREDFLKDELKSAIGNLSKTSAKIDRLKRAKGQVLSSKKTDLESKTDLEFTFFSKK